MKKMKGVAAPYGMYEDQRARFKHHSLMQDFQDLHKETEAMRKKLQMLKEQKSTLLAEVRFLKRRHKFFMQNRSSNTKPERFFAMIKSKSNMKEKKSTGKEHTLRTGFDLNQKGRIYSEKETTFTHPSPMFDLNRKQPKVFDLNQISIEEEELEANDDSMRIDEFEKSSIRNVSDDQQNDVKLSAWLNTGNGPNRVGKRKITWQDQVALRV